MADKTISITLKANTQQFEKSMGQAQKTISGFKNPFSTITKGIGGLVSGFGKLAGTVGVFKLVSAGMDMIKGSVEGAVKRVDTLNQFPKVMQLMGYSSEDANKSVSKLADGIQGLPTTLGEVVSTTQRLVNATGSLDKATDLTLALNNAFLASGSSSADAARGTEQYIQMLSAGKVDMQSWRTLQETMPYALQETAEAFGFTGASAQNDFYDALQSGQIPMTAFSDKIIELSGSTGGFADVALESSKGIQTSMQNIKTAVTNGVAGAIQSFDSWLQSKGLGGIAGVLDGVKESVKGVFGKVNEVIPQALNKFDELYNKVKESESWQTFMEVVENTKTKIQELWDGFKNSKEMETAKGILKDIEDTLLNIDFNKVVEDLGTFIEQWTPVIAAIAAGIAAFKTIQTAITIVEGLSAAIGFLTSPVGIAVVAVGLLVAAGVALYQNWDEIKAKCSEIWDAVSAKISEVWEAIKQFFSDTWESIKEVFSTAMEAISTALAFAWEVIKGIIETVMTIIETIIRTIWEVIKAIFTNVMNVIKAVIDAVWAAIGDKITAVMNTISSVVSTIWNAIKDVVSTVVGAIKNAVGVAWDWISSKTSTIFNAIKGVVSTIWNGIKSVISTVVETVKTVVSNVWTAISTTTSNVFNAIKSVATNVWNSIKTAISNVVNGVKSVVSSVWEGIKNTTSSVFNGIKNVATSVWNGIRDAMTKPVETAKNTISGIIDKIKGFFSGLKLKFPKIEMPKLPHFSIKGSFSLKPPSVPHLGVDWYETGGIFDGSRDGQVVGLGENHGSEAILPLSKRSKMAPFASAIASMMPERKEENSNSGNGSVIINVDSVVVREEKDIKKIAQELFKLEQRERKGRGKAYA